MYWNSWIQTTQLETSRTVILLPPTISFLCSNYLPTRYLRHHERRWNENPLRRTPTHWFPLSKSNFWQRTRWTKGYTKGGGVVMGGGGVERGVSAVIVVEAKIWSWRCEEVIYASSSCNWWLRSYQIICSSVSSASTEKERDDKEKARSTNEQVLVRYPRVWTYRHNVGT